MWPTFCSILTISLVLGVKPNLRNTQTLQHQGNGPGWSQWHGKYPTRAVSKFPLSTDRPCALHHAPWMLVNQNIGHLPISSLNALQLSGFVAWGVVPEAGAPKLCWDLCAGMGNTSLFKLHCLHHHVKVGEVSAAFSFLYNKVKNALKVQIKLFNTGTAPEMPQMGNSSNVQSWYMTIL